MKILFITLEESGRQNLRSILNNNFFKINKKNIHSYGMDDNDHIYKDHTDLRIKSLMGLTNIILNLFYIFNLRKNLHKIIKNNSFTHVFFIDSFDFTKFYLNKYLNNNIKYCQIIGPSVFLWKKHKADFINKNLDHLFSIFKIEKNYYLPSKYSYIGHPLRDSVIKKKYFSNNINIIGFFLGSRNQEVIPNSSVVYDLILELRKLKDFKIIIFTTKNYYIYLKTNFDDLNDIQVVINDHNYYEKISSLDFAFACSGTVHLELCFANIPHFIFYKANLINYFLFKKLIKIDYLSLLNIFNKESIVKEFVQRKFKADILLRNFLLLFNDINNYHNYSKLIENYVDKSNFDEFNPRPIIDYLKKSS